jgi:voltage-gated potassium channel
MIMYAAQIYEKFKFIFKFFDFRKGVAEKHSATVVLKNHIILVGAHRLGHHLIDALKKQKTPFVIVDFDPEIVERYAEAGLLAVCGDITDEFVQEQINLSNAKLIISTVPDFNDNLALVHAIHTATAHRRVKPKLIFSAQDDAETKVLYEKNLDYVISPHFMGGLHLAKILESRELSSGLKKLREHHLNIIGSN